MLIKLQKIIKIKKITLKKESIRGAANDKSLLKRCTTNTFTWSVVNRIMNRNAMCCVFIIQV
jgi:hypothetical protein